MRIDREALAWAAGFYEGEGHIGTRREGSSLRVTQADPECLARLAAIFGFGTVRSIKPGGRLGKKPLFVWDLSNYEHVQAFIAAVWPWLSVRRRAQAARALLAKQGTQTHCKRGHDLANSWIDRDGHRHCRQCHNMAQKERNRLRVVAV